jgi:hypothetical protein
MRQRASTQLDSSLQSNISFVETLARTLAEGVQNQTV